MKSVAALLPLAMLSLSLIPAPVARAADECDLPHVSCLVELDVQGSTFYVDDRGAASEGVWLYEESNAIASLQRGGCASLLPNDCESAAWTDPGVRAGNYHPDTLLL